MSSECPYANWHARATPHPDPTTFTPTRAALALIVLRNTPVEPEGFTLALFDLPHEKVAVNALGNVLCVKEDDFQGIIALAARVSRELPPTGRFRNTWVVKHIATSQPIERLLVSIDHGKLVETSVQGFSKDNKTLQIPVGDITELPDVLSETVGVVMEARDGYSRIKADKGMVTKVQEIVRDEVML
ncbi:hypothetical protein C8F01DRAFT_324353 [Mycena amicta]|nr:hypothetical protein C8F01DRAFT_324353 [Mycena amicta]